MTTNASEVALPIQENLLVVVEIRSTYHHRLWRLGTGTFLLLVLGGLCAPATTLAGCNHRVVSRTDTIQMQTAVDAFLYDIAERPLPSPKSPRPCSGAWCSGQPVVPPVPAGERDWQADSWAWNAWGSIVFVPSFSRLPVGDTATHRIVLGSGIFHPPRNLSSSI